MDGVLVVDKPAGPTSHDVVDRIRRTFGFQRVGHGGTLDPQATGLLVILVGRGTKLSSHFIGSDKTYEGRMRLGVATDSHDAQGRVVREADYRAVTQQQVEAEMKKRTGDMLQTPPMVSAVKVGGVPLYKRARKGTTVEREPRLIHVYEFSLLGFDPPTAEFRVRCTKGTYVRSLCAEVGEALGCGAHLDRLCRLQCGDLRLTDALSLDKILGMRREEFIGHILPVRRFPSL
jgi:tRNA pseudouridine55 synthase